MSKRILLIGPTVEDRQNQIRLLHALKAAHCIVAQMDSESATAEILREKVRVLKITHVVCVKTKNGSTCYWAEALSTICCPCPEFYGVEIPPHPQNISHKGMRRIKMIGSVKELFRKEKVYAEVA